MCSGAVVTALSIPQLLQGGGFFLGLRCGWAGKTWSTDGAFLKRATARSLLALESTSQITSTSSRGWRTLSRSLPGEPTIAFEIFFLRSGAPATVLFFMQ